MRFENRTTSEKLWRPAFFAICAFVLAFLTLPILAIAPLSVNDSMFLAYPFHGFSWRWYHEFLNGARWIGPLRNSLFIASAVTIVSAIVGTAAAVGMSFLSARYQRAIKLVTLLPLIVPVAITGTGIYFLFSQVGLTGSFTGLVLAHTVLALPFVVFSVSTSLQGVDRSLLRAASSLGASPAVVIRRIVVPLVAPGIMVGSILAFITSFDEVVIALFIAGPTRRTLPIQMLLGLREEMRPTFIAAACILTAISAILVLTLELLRRRDAIRKHVPSELLAVN